MHTVELLLDPALDRGVRELWGRLHAAGMPSLAGHPHPTNRPHLTVARAASLDGLGPLPLPVEVTLGPVRLLGRALVREVEATAALRELHAYVFRSLPDPWPPPEEWTPHVSLALRADPASLDILGDLPPARGRLVAARSYDTTTRTVTDLG